MDICLNKTETEILNMELLKFILILAKKGEKHEYKNKFYNENYDKLF